MVVGQPAREGVQPALARPHRPRWSPDAAYVYPLATVVLVLLAWEAAARLGYVPRYLLPAPTGILARGSQLATFLVRESLVTLQEVLLGFGLSVALGVPLAIGLVAWPSFQRAVYPLLVGTQVVPKLAIAPLFLVWFGFGMPSKVLVAFLVAFFPIVIDSVIGLRSVETAKLYVARAAGAGELQLFWLVRLPNALP
ncbi:MAG TPA: ABC transporter permease subunit, partial [Chloroflexota bacterium]|nr:ABC transporter permease subunit [Chloroflexota bacterium]